MSTRLLRGASALLAAAALTLGTTSVASAATWSHPDATGDVASSTDGGTTTTPAPTNTSADITALRVAHNTGSVVVRITTKTALPTSNGAAVVDIATSTAKFEVSLGKIVGGLSLAKPSGKPVPCNGLKGVDDTVHHRVQITVPRSCIGKPHWVKVGAGVVVYKAATNTMFADDANSATVGDNLVLGNKVVVG